MKLIDYMMEKFTWRNQNVDGGRKWKQKKKQIAEKAFRPGNPSKKQASSGDYYGVIIKHTLAWRWKMGKFD